MADSIRYPVRRFGMPETNDLSQLDEPTPPIDMPRRYYRQRRVRPVGRRSSLIEVDVPGYGRVTVDLAVPGNEELADAWQRGVMRRPSDEEVDRAIDAALATASSPRATMTAPPTPATSSASFFDSGTGEVVQAEDNPDPSRWFRLITTGDARDARKHREAGERPLLVWPGLVQDEDAERRARRLENLRYMQYEHPSGEFYERPPDAPIVPMRDRRSSAPSAPTLAGTTVEPQGFATARTFTAPAPDESAQYQYLSGMFGGGTTPPPAPRSLSDLMAAYTLAQAQDTERWPASPYEVF